MPLSEKQQAWKQAHRLRAEEFASDITGGGVRLCYGESGVSRVTTPDGVWFECDDEKYATLADALEAHGIH